VVNAPFVRDDAPAVEGPKWWEDPRVRDALRLLVGAVVVLALLFGVLRPSIRQIVSPPAPKKEEEAGPATAEVSLVEDGEDLPALAEDTAQLGLQAQQPPAALPSNAYEDRLRNAREAVRADSKRVAQVVKEWLGNEAA